MTATNAMHKTTDEDKATTKKEEVHIIDKLNAQCRKKAEAFSTLKPEDEHYGCFELCLQGHPVSVQGRIRDL